MIVMITEAFYSEYELYKTDDLEGLKNLISLSYTSGEDLLTDRNKYNLIGCQDDIEMEQALEMSDEIVYLGELETMEPDNIASDILHKNGSPEL